jgi:hypothetical protein
MPRPPSSRHACGPKTLEQVLPRVKTKTILPGEGGQLNVFSPRQMTTQLPSNHANPRQWEQH